MILARDVEIQIFRDRIRDLEAALSYARLFVVEPRSAELWDDWKRYQEVMRKIDWR